MVVCKLYHGVQEVMLANITQVYTDKIGGHANMPDIFSLLATLCKVFTEMDKPQNEQ